MGYANQAVAYVIAVVRDNPVRKRALGHAASRIVAVSSDATEPIRHLTQPVDRVIRIVDGTGGGGKRRDIVRCVVGINKHLNAPLGGGAPTGQNFIGVFFGYLTGPKIFLV